jgi:tRNA pseudouridine38-40 synthase
LRLDLAYDGTSFSGWAAQPGRRTVQQTVEAALATVLRLPEVRVTVAGRTDAGVHARGQVCSANVETADEDWAKLRRRLNGVLPDDVVVRRVERVGADFDARFSARWRRYAYRLVDDEQSADPLRRLEVLPWPRPLNEAAMNAAAARLRGEHDFAAFCRRREGTTTVRRLTELAWVRDGGLLIGRVVADSFCHNMVRALVGCLVVVGEGRQPVDWPAQILERGVRDSRVPVVPPQGLTLEEVGY